MAALSAQEVYARYVKPLSPAERLRLLELTARDLATTTESPTNAPKRSIMELHGLGKENRLGMDAQDYINQIRSEWDERP